MAREFEVDGTKADEANKGFAPLIPGKYIAKIVDVKDGVYKKDSNNPGRPKLSVRFKIIEGPEGVGRQFTDFNLPLFQEWNSGKVAVPFYKFFGSLGVVFPKKGEKGTIEVPDNEEILGEEIGITLKTEEKFSSPGEKESKVDSYKYFSASDGLPDVEVGSDEFTL